DVFKGRTCHAEGVDITFDPIVVSYEELFYVFFMSHDPTSLNRQGADVGTQYRSAVFYTNDEQLQTADAVIRLLEEQQIFDQPIVTSLKPFEVFYTAEEEHQNFYQQNQEHPYCQYVIHPKLQTLKTHQKKLQTMNCVDFDDLILHVVTILKKFEDIRKIYQNNFKYILVDEFQDTNYIQNLWLQLLTSENNNICV
ncbi:MAG: peptide-methionine (S)-S-oxide reductase MsrA, partial [Flavobacteriaceae bacterium]